MPVDLEQRLLAYVEKTSGCWLWTGSKAGGGYGQMWYMGRMVYVHRVAYEIYVAEIPEGLTIDHLCHTRNCVNPDHLEAVSFRENVLRGNGPTAINARKTHCKNGHEFTPENTFISRKAGRDPSRGCRKCRLEYKRQWREVKVG